MLIQQARAPLLLCHALAGDLLMAVPALRALGQRYGFDRPLVCGTEPEHIALLQAVGFECLHPTTYATRDLRPGESLAEPCDWGFDVDAVLPLARQCDLLISVIDAPGPAVMKLASAAGLPSVGFHDDADRPVRFASDSGHVVDCWFELARALCGESAVVANHAWFPHRRDATEIRRQVREATGAGRLLALHADTKPNKMWPLACWAAWLARLWQEEPGTQVLLLGYPALPIELFAVDARLHDCRDLPLTVDYEIAGMVNQFIGVDSCMIHAADLCRTPSVGLFTECFPPRLYGLRFADGEMLCGSNPPDGLSVDEVWQAYCRVRDRQLPPCS